MPRRLGRPQIGWKDQIFPKPGEYDDLKGREWEMEQEQQQEDWRSPNETGHPARSSQKVKYPSKQKKFSRGGAIR